MQDCPSPNCLAALDRIADEIANLRKVLKPGEVKHQQTDEELAEDVRRINHKVFGDEY